MPADAWRWLEVTRRGVIEPFAQISKPAGGEAGIGGRPAKREHLRDRVRLARQQQHLEDVDVMETSM